MSDLTLPPVAYHLTAHRPGWAQLPAELRAAVDDRLGSPVIHATGTGAGFTQGFASLLSTADGRRHFVKAAPHGTPMTSWYEREARLTALLPAGVPSARVRWAEGGGLPVDALFAAHPTAAGLEPAALDTGLAAVLGYYLHASAQDPVPGSPAIRGHQRYYGQLALRWLSRRQRWNAP